MKCTYLYMAVSSLLILLVSGCGAGKTISTPTPSPKTDSCVPSTAPHFAYVLTGYAVSMYTVDSCTGAFTASSPASVSTGYSYPQEDAEEMVADPLGRFAYVANLVSNASGPSTISMYTIDSSTGVLNPTTPATVPTGWFPQEIAIDPLGRFVYTANSDDSTVSMFTINQSTGVLTPTTPASVSTLIPGEFLSQPNFLTVDPTGKFLYVTALDSVDASVSMFMIDQTTGVLTPTSPATVLTFGSPWQVVVTPSGKFAYVVNNDSGGGYDTTEDVFQYTVDPSTGVLTPNTPASIAAGDEPTGIAVDPTSKFAYVVNRNDNTVSMFTIDPDTGNLALNASSTNPTGTIATGNEPFRIAFDPSGKFVYVINEQNAASIYTINSDGTLDAAGTTGNSTGALSIAIAAATH
jgi:6-phosphogluconolactonase